MHVQSLNHHRVTFGLVAVLSVLGAACADENSADGASTDEASDNVAMTQSLVAEVEGDGYRIKYYEPEPGILVEDETGSARARHFIEDHDLDFVQRYELIAGRKAPLSLVQAAARARVPTHEGESVPARAPDSNQKANPTSTELWFRQNFCVRTDHFWGSGNGWLFENTTWSDRVEYMKAGAWVGSLGPGISGMSYTISYRGAGDWSYGLGAHEYGGKRVTSAINRAAESRAFNAGGGTSYIHCVNYHY